MFVKRIFLLTFFGIFLAAFFTACSPLKYVPKGKQLLVKNSIEINGKRVSDGTAKSVIKQKPNRVISVPATDIVLWRPYLMLYNWGNPAKEKGFAHWLTKIGEAPVVADSAAMLGSARQLGQYYFNRGYFFNEVEFTIDFKRDSTRAGVNYKIYSGPQYYFNTVEYVISSPGIAQVVGTAQAESKIKAGMPYNTADLEGERDRLVAMLRNNGYYGFQKSLVRFVSDTSAGDHSVNITMIVGDKPGAVGDSVYYIEHIPYTIQNVFIDPNYNFSAGGSAGVDSVLYKELTIIHAKPIRYKASFLESQIHLKPHKLYNEQEVKETYRHLTGNRVFRVAEITFENIEGDTTNGLNAIIQLEPYLKKTFTAELEGTTTAGNYGVAGVLTWAMRNFFKGGEIVDFSVRGGLEAQANIEEASGIFNTFEVGTEIGINFPRFVLSGGWNQRIPKRMEPKSRIYTSYSYQTRVEFERTILAVGLQYSWRESNTKFHQVNLFDINYVRLPRIDQDYLNSLEFKTGFQDNLIMATRYTFMYDNIKFTNDRSAQFFRASIENSGGLLALLNSNNTFAQDPETDQYLALGVPYAQYVKLDFDFRNFAYITKEHQVVTRAFVGTTINYGNSPYLPPFEKSFLAGGSNDIRGWTAYHLGPGNFPNYLYNYQGSSYAAVAPIKILGSVEYRFPILKALKGALFIDAGNIWLWDRSYDQNGLSEVELALVEYGIFQFNTFWKQIATNTGVGFRYDFGFFAFRLDLGIKVWDPSEPENQQYVLPGLKWNTITYNIALGYPF